MSFLKIVPLRFSTAVGRQPSVLPCAIQTCLFRQPTSARLLLLQKSPQLAASRLASATRHLQTATSQADQEQNASHKEERRPWHRAAKDTSLEGAEHFPISHEGDASTGKFGRVLTTPTRLLKLIVPLPLHSDQAFLDQSSDSTQRAQPLALLVHPHQPLSYIAGLIQAELPPLKMPDGATRLPTVHFRAMDVKEPTAPSTLSEKRSDKDLKKTLKIPSSEKWIRWSGSTEVGDFVRDAARGGAFVVDIEGLSPEDEDRDGRRDVGGVRVAVPSFGQRTFYMRRRLRGMAKKVEEMVKIKHECDMIAYSGANRLAKIGFGVTGVWWVIVYYASFHTTLTWDTMEPITYLAGLLIIMAGYWYFLYVSRDLSYKAALRITVSRRQHTLYKARGFDMEAWDDLVRRANELKAEIKLIADEYAVDWNERDDLGSDQVKDALEKEEDEWKGKAKGDKGGEKSKEERDSKETETSKGK